MFAAGPPGFQITPHKVSYQANEKESVDKNLFFFLEGNAVLFSHSEQAGWDDPSPQPPPPSIALVYWMECFNVINKHTNALWICTLIPET